MFYALLYKLVSIPFNILNFILAGKLPPFGRVCIIIEEHGHYLVIEHTANEISFPGGFMRWREHPVQAAQREGEEETGLHLRIGDIIGYYSNISARFDRMSTLTICYTGEVVGGELSSSAEGQPRWLDESELRSKLDASYRIMLDDYLHYRSERA